MNPYLALVLRGVHFAFNLFTFFLNKAGLMTVFISVSGLYTTYRLFLSQFFGGGTERND